MIWRAYLDPSELARKATVARLGVAGTMSFLNTSVVHGVRNTESVTVQGCLSDMVVAAAEYPKVVANNSDIRLQPIGGGEGQYKATGYRELLLINIFSWSTLDAV
jgi:hypothetical protein